MTAIRETGGLLLIFLMALLYACGYSGSQRAPCCWWPSGTVSPAWPPAS